MNKKLLIPLSVVLLFLGSSANVHAASVSDYLTDGKLVINAIAPADWNEAYVFVSSSLMSNEEVSYGMIGNADTCNADFTSCEVSMGFTDESSSVETVDIEYRPTNSIVKSKVDSFIDAIGEFPVFALNDLEVINYMISASQSTLSDGAVKNLMSDYSGELKEKLQNSNITLDFRTATALGSDGYLHLGLGGDAVLKFNDIGYGYLGTALMLQKNVIYVPTGTSDAQLLAVAQERINNYLGNEDIVLSEGGALSSLIPNSDDLAQELDTLGVSGITQYYTLTYDGVSYDFLIVADSTKMVTPSLVTQDLITNARISTAALIPLDSAINASILTSGDDYEEIANTLKKSDVEMYDLGLHSKTLDGDIADLTNGTFEVRILIPSKFEGKDLIVEYVDPDGKIKKYEVTVSNGYAVFTTDHFSIYTLSEKSGEANPDTYDGIMVWIILGSISLIGLVGTVIYRRKSILS